MASTMTSTTNSTSTTTTTTTNSVIEATFLIGWRAGIKLFLEHENVGVLDDAFNTAHSLCTPNGELVQLAFRTNRILLHKIIERKAANVNDITTLEEIGSSIAKLIPL